jgi:hypothetical protein
LVRDENLLLCQVQPDQAGRGIHPAEAEVQRLATSFDGLRNEDDVEEVIVVKECGQLLSNLKEQ